MKQNLNKTSSNFINCKSPTTFENKNQRAELIKKSFLLITIFLFTSAVFKANAATYYLTTTGVGAAQTPANWNTGGIGGGGTVAPNFTTDADIFIISSGQTATFGTAVTFGNSSGANVGVNLTINAGGTANFGANTITMAAKGNGRSSTLTVNGTIQVNSNANQINATIGSGSCSTIFILGSGGTLITANANGIINGVLGTISTSFTTTTLNAAANYEFNDAAQTTTGLPATVANLTLSGTGAKTLTTTTTSITGNLTLSGTASTTTVVGLTVGGNVVVGNGTNAATLTAAAFALSVTGTTTVANASTLAISSATGTKTFTGAVTINAGGIISESAAATLSFGNNVTIAGTLTEFGAAVVGIAGNLTNNGTYTASTGVHTFSGKSKTIGGTTTNTIPTATFTGTYTNNGTLTCATLLTITTVALTNTGIINSATSLTGTGTLANTAGTVNITAGSIGITTNTNGGTFAINSTATSTTAVANFTNTGTVNILGSGTITGITNNAAGIVNHSGSSTVTSFNNATSTSTLNISTTPTVPTFTTLTTTAAGNTVNYNATGPQTLIATTYSNLTISGTGTNAKIAGGGITVNGVLTLTSDNASSSAGALDMSTYTLTMGATATTLGTGDVTGIVSRNTFVTTTPYTFGNRYTTITITSGTTPTNITVKIVLTPTHTWKSDAIHRYLDIIRTGGASDSRISLSMHYLVSELNSITEENIDFFDYITATSTDLEHGHSNKNFTEHWYELSNLSLFHVAETTFGTKYWTLAQGDTANNVTWISGGVSLTDWNLADNWVGGIPTSISNVIIPSITVSSTADNPILPNTASIYTIRILSGGVLNATTGSPTLTITDGVGAWNNSGTFNYGTSTVIFTSANATMADPTTFYNVTIATGAVLTLGTDNIMRIAGTFTNNAIMVH